MGYHRDGSSPGAASDVLTVAKSGASDGPKPKELPCYSCAKVPLPTLNDDLTAPNILMWEAVTVQTEAVGITLLLNVHTSGHRIVQDKGAGTPIQGPSCHLFGVGGEPMDLQFCTLNSETKYPAEVGVPTKLTTKAQVLDPTLKAKLDEDGFYPVECWVPDPARNENFRYYGSVTGGAQTPPVMSITNTLTTVLLDDNGVGPLCKGDGLYVMAADIYGLFTSASGDQWWRGAPRYFKIKLRKRSVRNPYNVGALLNNMFQSYLPRIQGQTMSGDDAQIEEVRVYQGTEPLPGDSSMERFVDMFGNEKTAIPVNDPPDRK